MKPKASMEVLDKIPTPATGVADRSLPVGGEIEPAQGESYQEPHHRRGAPQQSALARPGRPPTPTAARGWRVPCRGHVFGAQEERAMGRGKFVRTIVVARARVKIGMIKPGLTTCAPCPLASGWAPRVRFWRSNGWRFCVEWLNGPRSDGGGPGEKRMAPPPQPAPAPIDLVVRPLKAEGGRKKLSNRHSLSRFPYPIFVESRIQEGARPRPAPA